MPGVEGKTDAKQQRAERDGDDDERLAALVTRPESHCSITSVELD